MRRVRRRSVMKEEEEKEEEEARDDAVRPSCGSSPLAFPFACLGELTWNQRRDSHADTRGLILITA